MSLWQVWVIFALLMIIVEVFTTGFVVFCFAFGGIVAALFAVLGVPMAWQVTVFAVATAATFFFVRPLALRFFARKDNVETNAAAIIGRTATVSEAMGEMGGRVKIDGDDWKAVAEDGALAPGETWAVGTKVVILAIEGIIVTVRKA